MVGHVPRAGTDRRLGILGFEGGDFTSLAVISILKESEVLLHIGYINILSVWRK
tara:strand:- start:265 stop:426 length:162 start_codon:yes stop_codon:yes gene_type:complete